MFNQTFVEATAKTQKPYTVVLSLVMQISAICLMILAPLVYTQTLPSTQLKSMLTAPPPPPPPMPKPVGMKTRVTVVPRVFNATKLIAPSVIPKRVNNVSEALLPDAGLTGVMNSVPDTGNALLYGSTGPPAQPPAPPATKPSHASGPLRIGGMVAEANLIHKVQPLYPALAKSARVQGTVEFKAIISKDGRVEHLELLHGHPLLVNAAKDAILQWRYRPTTLNGQPVEVLTDILVNFTLAP